MMGVESQFIKTGPDSRDYTPLSNKDKVSALLPGVQDLS